MSNKAIIAIGGGEIGRVKTLPDGTVKKYPVNTLHIDKEVIKLSGKINFKTLVIGTASHDNDDYYNLVHYHFTERLNSNVSRLNITDNQYSEIELKDKIFSSDIIYISGGDTRHMLNEWKKLGLDQILIDAYNKGVIIYGYSAGAICWFDYYDNFDYSDEENFKPELLKGLGIIQGLAVPHYDNFLEENRKIIKDLFKDKDGDFYGINNCEAVTLINDNIGVIKRDDK